MTDKDCPRCKQRGKTWEGSNPKCAFPSGVFTSDNWSCATMNALRDLECPKAWSEDQSSMLIPYSGCFIVIGWYKSRGRTEFAGIIADNEFQKLRLEDAEIALTHAHQVFPRETE